MKTRDLARVGIPPACAELAKRLSVLVELIETGLQAKEAEKARFLDLARRFKEATAPEESERLREELARLTFGE